MIHFTPWRMPPMRRVAGAALLSMAFTAAPALSQPPPCGNLRDISDRLRTQYGEVPVSQGITPSGFLLTLYTSEDGSFTLALIRPDGYTCLLAVGEEWGPVKERARGVSFPNATPHWHPWGPADVSAGHLAGPALYRVTRGNQNSMRQH